MPTVKPAEITVLTTIKLDDADGNWMAIIDEYADKRLSLASAGDLDNPLMRIGLAQAAAMWPIFKHYAETGSLAGYKVDDSAGRSGPTWYYAEARTIADYKPPGVPDADR